MKKLRAKDFTITSQIVREPIHEDQCWYFISYNGNEFHKCPTKTEASKYISKLVKFANCFLVEHPEAYVELSQKVADAKQLVGGNLHKDGVPAVIKEAAQIKEMLEQFESVLSKENGLVERKKASIERE